MKERIGFIGVGLMGHGMAKNLVEKGHPLTVLGHKNRVPIEDLKKRGASEAKTPEGAGRNLRRGHSLRHRRAGSRGARARQGRPQGRRQEGPGHRRHLDLGADAHDFARRRTGAARRHLHRRAARAHPQGGRGGPPRHHGRRHARGLRPHQAGARLFRREHQSDRADRRRPHHEADQQFRLARLWRDLFRGAGARRARSGSPQKCSIR